MRRRITTTSSPEADQNQEDAQHRQTTLASPVTISPVTITTTLFPPDPTSTPIDLTPLPPGNDDAFSSPTNHNGHGAGEGGGMMKKGEEAIPGASKIAIAVACVAAVVIFVSLSLWFFRDEVFRRRWRQRAGGRGSGGEEGGKGGESESARKGGVEGVEMRERGGGAEVSDEDEEKKSRNDEEKEGPEEEDSLAKILEVVKRYRRSDFNVGRRFSVARRQEDEDEILPVGGGEQMGDGFVRVYPPVSPRPVAVKKSDTAIRTPQDSESTPSKSTEQISHTEVEDSPLPRSLVAGHQSSLDWPISNDLDISDETRPVNTSTLTPLPARGEQDEEEQPLSLTFVAAPGYTSPLYTPSKYYPSPPSNLENKETSSLDSTTTPPPRPLQSWPLGELSTPFPSTTITSARLFRSNDNGDEVSDYRPSPPPTLPNAARPLSLVQEYSLAAFPFSPSPLFFHANDLDVIDGEEGEEENKEEDGERSEYHPSPPPNLPNAARPMSLVQEYSLAAFPASPSPLPPVSFSAPPPAKEEEEEQEAQTSLNKDNNSVSLPSSSRSLSSSEEEDSLAEDYTTATPTPTRPATIPNPYSPIFPTTAADDDGSPLHRPRTLSSAIAWEETQMDLLILQSSRRDSARERERSNKDHSSSFSSSSCSFSPPGIGGLSASPTFPQDKSSEEAVVGTVEDKQTGDERTTESDVGRKNETSSRGMVAAAAPGLGEDDISPPQDFFSPDENGTTRPLMRGCEGQ